MDANLSYPTVTDQADAEARIRARAAPMISRAIGQSKTMRLGPGLTQTGVIVEAEVDRVRLSGRAYEAIFRIVMECGASRTRREFFVRSLPQ